VVHGNDRPCLHDIFAVFQSIQCLSAVSSCMKISLIATRTSRLEDVCVNKPKVVYRPNGVWPVYTQYIRTSCSLDSVIQIVLLDTVCHDEIRTYM